MTYILHLSDPHFGTERAEVVSALEAWIRQNPPDLLVLSGDITQRARLYQFERAQAFLRRLPPGPRIVVPGNHDLPLFNPLDRLLYPYANYDKVFPERESVWNDKDITFIGFDTTNRFRHTRGELTRAQVMRYSHKIRHQPGRLLLACIHQPLDTALPEDREKEYLLVRSAEAAHLLSEMQVDVVLSGHVHVPLIATTRTAFPHLQRHFILSGAGTAVSDRVRHDIPNSFNTIHTETAGETQRVTVCEYHFDGQTSTFRKHFARAFSPSPSGWLAED